MNQREIIIVILVGALLWMFFKSHKGDVCSLIGGNKEKIKVSLYEDADYNKAVEIILDLKQYYTILEL